MFELILKWAWYGSGTLGAILIIWSHWHLSEAGYRARADGGKLWHPIWKSKSLYTPVGYRMFVIGLSIFIVGAAISLYRLIAM